jgi:hypothetical protein
MFGIIYPNLLFALHRVTSKLPRVLILLHLFEIVHVSEYCWNNMEYYTKQSNCTGRPCMVFRVLLLVAKPPLNL